MRSTLRATSRRAAAKGFTLVEMLIIAPIVLLIVSGFIALMVALVGDVLLTRDRNVLAYDANEALNRIEQDAHLSSKFLSTTGALTAPQGSSSNFTGSEPFTNTSDTLIFSEPATDESPLSPTRSLIYYAYQPNACGFGQTFNRIFTIKVVYFIKDNALWRRTLVPDHNTNSPPDANTICNTLSFDRPWARNSCSPGYTASRCETNDEKIMENIVSLDTEYYSNPSSTTDLGAENAESATAIKVTLTSEKTTAGRTFTVTDSLLAHKINNLDTDVPAPNTPVITHSMPQPDKVTFEWTAVPEIVSYDMSYNINGGSWVNQSLSKDDTSYTIDANRGDTVTFKLTAISTTLSSEEATDVATMDLWTNLNLQYGWEIYSTSSYSSPQFTKSSTGVVILKGLIKNGATGTDTIIARLPEGYRPAGRIFFQTSTHNYTSGRVDIDSDGYVRIYYGSNDYFALDGITFLPASSPYTWRSTSFTNGWSDYGGSWEPVHSAIDSLGRVHVQGVARAGDTSYNTIMGQPSNNSGMIPPYPMHFPAGSSTWINTWIWDGAGQYVKRSPESVSYLAPYAFFYPGSTGSWSNPSSWSNGWSNLNGGYPPLQCTKASDDIVTVRGVIKGGTVSRNIVVATLPAHCRPEERQIFTVVTSGDDYARIDVEPDGRMKLVEGTGTWVTANFSFIGN